MKSLSNLLSIAAFALGAILLLANCLGVLTPLRNPQIYSEPRNAYPSDIVLTADEVLEVIDSPIEDRKSYVRRLTRAVNRGVAHYWYSDGIGKYRLRIPLRENYFLFTASYVWPKLFQKYEFMTYRRALKRGVGLCSQQSVIVAGALKSRGIPSRIIGLDGHVVAAAQVDPQKDEWWILDADYGVVVPLRLAAIEADPTAIAPFYREAGFEESKIERLVEIYGKAGNVRVEDARHFSWPTYYFEQTTYVLIWIVPFVLMAPLGIRLYRRARSRAAQATAAGA
jgi:hypothetical protein